jgi:citrate synthase
MTSLLGGGPRWRTAVSSVAPDGPRLRGYPLNDLAASDAVAFSDLLYLTATGRLPDEGCSRMLRMMLGVTVAAGVSLTGVATRAAAAAGVPVQVAICAGLTTIGDEVGGALPGFGHALHASGDPRAALLLSRAAACGVDGPYVAILRRLEALLAERKGRRIAPNIDGADAALLCELGMPWPYARPVVMLGRMIGLAGIAAECATGDTSLPSGLLDFDYDGPPDRPLPPGY